MARDGTGRIARRLRPPPVVQRSASIAQRLLLAVILFAAAACAGGPASEESGADGTEDRPATVIEGTDGLLVLPVRSGPREETTYNVPHVQTSAVIVPEIDAELERRAYSLPGVEKRESVVSLPGARSLWLAEDVEVARPEVLQFGREFGHIHPNGSLHVLLPVDRAIEVTETHWGTLHPWVGRDDFWDGLVMIFTPENPEELDVTMRLIIDAYNYLTGADIDPGTVT